MAFSVTSADQAELDPSNNPDNVTPSIYSNEIPGRTVGANFGFGGRIAKKWILETGIGYENSTIDGTTNAIQEVENGFVPVFHSSEAAGEVTTGSTFDVTNSFQFVTVPIKAGYILLDKKLGIVATGGIGSNILVSSKIESNEPNLNEADLSGGESPYRPLSLTGIVGTQFYLNLAENYQLLFSPQYNFGITELTKAESSFSIVPNSFNIGVTFRYLLN